VVQGQFAAIAAEGWARGPDTGGGAVSEEVVVGNSGKEGQDTDGVKVSEGVKRWK
jgi:hypothetical protein